MSFGYYMNIEILALETANEHIEKMTDTNSIPGEYGYDVCHENGILKNNMKNGWIAVLMLINYVESVINTILRDCVNYKGDTLIRMSTDEKIELLYLCYKTDFSVLKSLHEWEVYKSVSRIRNELVHYKNNKLGVYGDMPIIWDNRLHNILYVFTKPEMKKIQIAIMEFCKKIVLDFDLELKQDVFLFDCDGRADNVSYISNPKLSKTEIQTENH